MYIKYRYINGLPTYDAAYMYMYIYAASIYIWSMWVYEYMLGSWISWCFWLVNGRCVCSQTTNVLLDVNVICGSVPSKMMLSLLILLTVSISSRLCVSSHVWKRGGGFARDKSSVERIPSSARRDQRRLCSASYWVGRPEFWPILWVQGVALSRRRCVASSRNRSGWGCGGCGILGTVRRKQEWGRLRLWSEEQRM